MDNRPTISLRSARVITPGGSQFPEKELVFHRHSLIEDWIQESLGSLMLNVIGSGALGGNFARGAVRMGVGRLNLFDFDTVDPSNIPRQFFFFEDVGKNKAISLAKNLHRERTDPNTIIYGYPYAFQRAVEEGLDTHCGIVFCGVDNSQTRVYVARHFYPKGIPVIFAAVDRQSTKGYVFVQESRPETPCFLCCDPGAEDDQETEGCAGVAIDIPLVVSGTALYAMETLVMDRVRQWNYKEVFLAGGDDGHRNILKRESCPICSGQKGG